MLIECAGCPGSGTACSGCLVAALWSMPAPRPLDPAETPLDAAELRAVEAFVAAGLVAPEALDELVAVRDAVALAV